MFKARIQANYRRTCSRADQRERERITLLAFRAASAQTSRRTHTDKCARTQTYGHTHKHSTHIYYSHKRKRTDSHCRKGACATHVALNANWEPTGREYRAPALFILENRFLKKGEQIIVSNFLFNRWI